MNLAYRMRPITLEEFYGQSHLVSKGKLLQIMIESGDLSSLIFWGPPGTGKTTLASIIAHATESEFHFISAVTSGKDALMKIVTHAQDNKLISKTTILFIDEIHRWSKSQQDALLPYVEDGTIILIGATTENPSFEVIGALLSRSRILTLNRLDDTDLHKIVKRALTDKEKGMGTYKKTLENDAEEFLIRLSGGDARVLLNALEIAITHFKEKKISVDIIKEIFQTKSAGLYDKGAEEHYNIISAFIKSMRASDSDAAVYYLARMLEAGEDPTFIARRMIIFSSEDIGLADRGALIQANEAFEAVEKIGLPEAKLILTHVVLYLARAPKSRLVPNTLAKAQKAVFDYPGEPVPLHLRNAPTKLMKDLGYSKDYVWTQNYVGPTKDISNLPEKLKGKKFVE